MTRAVVQAPHEGRRDRCVSRATGRGRHTARTPADSANGLQRAPPGTRLPGEGQRPHGAPARRIRTGQSGRSTATHAHPPRGVPSRPVLQGFRGQREEGPCPGLRGGTTRVVAVLRWASGSARFSSPAWVSLETSWTERCLTGPRTTEFLCAAGGSVVTRRRRLRAPPPFSLEKTGQCRRRNAVFSFCACARSWALVFVGLPFRGCVLKRFCLGTETPVPAK